MMEREILRRKYQIHVKVEITLKELQLIQNTFHSLKMNIKKSLLRKKKSIPARTQVQ